MKHHTLSRVGERIYWLGRYLERASNLARMIDVHGDLLMDIPRRMPLGWQPLVDVTGSRELFEASYPDYEERHVARFLSGDARNPGSVVNALSAARENARTVREIMPRATFELINDSYLQAKGNLSGQLSRVRRREALVGVTRQCELIEGFLSSNMLHDDAWQFMRIGNFIERADMTTRVVDVQTLREFGALEAFDDLGWRAVLRSLYALTSYHATMQEPVSQAPVLEFLFTNPQLPRSLLRGVDAVRRSLRQLPRNEKPLRLANRLRRSIANTPVRELSGETLHNFVDANQIGLNELHTQIGRTYFYYQPRLARSRSKKRPK